MFKNCDLFEYYFVIECKNDNSMRTLCKTFKDDCRKKGGKAKEFMDKHCPVTCQKCGK